MPIAPASAACPPAPSVNALDDAGTDERDEAEDQPDPAAARRFDGDLAERLDGPDRGDPAGGDQRREHRDQRVRPRPPRRRPAPSAIGKLVRARSRGSTSSRRTQRVASTPAGTPDRHRGEAHQRGLRHDHPADLAGGGGDRPQQGEVAAAVPHRQADGAGDDEDDQQHDVAAERAAGLDQQVPAAEVVGLLGQPAVVAGVRGRAGAGLGHAAHRGQHRAAVGARRQR